MEEKYDPHTVVMAAAGSAPDFDGAWMARLMIDYMVSRCPSLYARTEIARAQRFSTSGEMSELATFVYPLSRMHDVHVTLVVREWHAKRAEYLCRYWLLKRLGVKNATVSSVKVVSYALWTERVLRENLARVKAFFKVMLMHD